MSRIGDKPIDIPNGVKIGVADKTITVEGPLGKLDWTFRPEIDVKVDEETKKIRLFPNNNEKDQAAN